MSRDSQTFASPLRIERSAAVLHVTLDRPARANALDAACVERFLAVLDDPAFTGGLRGLVIAGSGNNFCGGFDLGNIAAEEEATIVVRVLRIEMLLQRLYHAPFLTIACAQGNAIGAGADLLAACTYRIVEAETRVRMPGWQFGIALGTRRLCDRIGADAAERFLGAGTTWRGSEALRAGLATHVAPRNEWEALVADAMTPVQQLSEDAFRRLRALCVGDHRDADMAALVTSALTAPGLKQRMLEYADGRRKRGIPGKDP